MTKVHKLGVVGSSWEQQLIDECIDDESERTALVRLSTCIMSDTCYRHIVQQVDDAVTKQMYTGVCAYAQCTVRMSVADVSTHIPSDISCNTENSSQIIDLIMSSNTRYNRVIDSTCIYTDELCSLAVR
jgi:hypothetical protein